MEKKNAKMFLLGATPFSSEFEVLSDNGIVFSIANISSRNLILQFSSGVESALKT